MANLLPFPAAEADTGPATSAPAAPDHARLIDRDELARRLSVGVSTLDRLRAAGKIGPRAIKCGGVRFLLTEVIAWLSTPDATGELYDAATWPAVWAGQQKRTGIAGHRI